MKQKQIKKLNTSLSKKNWQKKLPKEINSKAVGRKTNKNDETIKGESKHKFTTRSTDQWQTTS
jgi:hypothetical protein